MLCKNLQRMRGWDAVTAWKASWEEQLPKIDSLESHDRELLDENYLPQQKLVAVSTEKELHETSDTERTEAVTYVKVVLTNVKEAFHVLEGLASADR